MRCLAFLWNIPQAPSGGKWQTHGYFPNTFSLDGLRHLGKVDEKRLRVLFQDPSNSETVNVSRSIFSVTRCYTAALQIVVRAQKTREERIVGTTKAYDTVNGAFNFDLM